MNNSDIEVDINIDYYTRKAIDSLFRRDESKFGEYMHGDISFKEYFDSSLQTGENKT